MASKMKALQMWCKKNTEGYKDVNVVNMTTSWRDGLAFCALIHRFRPDLIDFASLSKENILYNNQLAFKTAENDLGIAALLDAEDMVAMKVPDKLSIITYVSQYYNCLHKLTPAGKDTKSLKREAPSNVLQEKDHIKRKAVESENVVKQVPTVPLAEKSQAFSICEMCKKKVHLVERFIDEGKVYHRQCHRTKSLTGMYRRDNSAAMYKNGSWNKPLQSQSKQNTSHSVAETNQVNSNKIETKETSKMIKPCTPTAALKLVKGAANEDCDKKVSDFTVATTTPEKRKSKVLEMAMTYTQHTSHGPKLDMEQSHPITRCETSQPTSTASDSPDNIMNINDTTNNFTSTHSKVPHKSDNNFGKNATDLIKSNPDSNDSNDKAHVSNYDRKHPVGSSKHNVIHTSVGAESSQETAPSSTVSDVTSRDILPTLLKSLADAKQKQTFDNYQRKIVNADDTSTSSLNAPLISELPKAGPSAKPRSSSGSANDLVNEKPRPRPRSNRSSFDDKVAKPLGTTVDKGKVNLGPFDTSDAMSTASSDDGDVDKVASSNPFDEAGSSRTQINSCHDASVNRIQISSINPITRTHNTPTKSIKPVKNGVGKDTSGKVRTGTINTVSANDERINPFNEEYEQKKQLTPKVPSRRKFQAPSPTNSSQKNINEMISSKTIESGIILHKSATQPETEHVLSVKDFEQKTPGRKSNTKQVETFKDQKYNKKTDKKYKLKATEKGNQAAISKPTLVTGTKNALHESNSGLPPHKQQNKPARLAPGFGFPLVKRRVKNQMTEEEIQNEMMVLDVQLKDLEKKGVKLEEVLRDEMEIAGVEWKTENDKVLEEWFELVHEKNKFVRRETELVFLMQQQRLEQEHADVEFKIRKLLNKPESEKTEEEKVEETKLLDQLIQVVERRNTIINSIEEERVKEEEEDAAYNHMKMLQKDCPNDSDATKKKKKNKVKKIFSKRKKTPKSPVSVSENSSMSSPPASH